MTESQMCVFFGWEIGSSMPRVYIDPSHIEITKAIRKSEELKEQDMLIEESPLKPRVCNWCKFENPAGSGFCARCARPLDTIAAMLFETKRTEADEITTLVMKRLIERAPELLKQIVEEEGLKERIERISK